MVTLRPCSQLPKSKQYICKMEMKWWPSARRSRLAAQELQLLTSQQQYHEGVQTMKRSQQLILSLAKLERDAFPSLQEIMGRGLNKALWIFQASLSAPFGFYGTHHSPSFLPLYAQVVTDSYEGMDQCFCKTENATKMLQVKGIKASPSLDYFKDIEILL